jgi:hypothetical protein
MAPEARLAQPANPMSDSEAVALLFVASCLSNQVALNGKRYVISRERGKLMRSQSSQTPLD